MNWFFYEILYGIDPFFRHQELGIVMDLEDV